VKVRITLILASIFIGGIAVYTIVPASFSNDPVRFVVPLEAKQDDTVRRLKDEGFIRSQKLFNAVSFLMKFPGTIEPGAYNLSKNMTIFTLAHTLLYKPAQKWVVVAPGNRNAQIAEKLHQSLKWDDTKRKEFLNIAKEGYMFPETYLIPVDETPEQVAKRMEAVFNERFDEKMYANSIAQNVRVDTIVKIASLIERESGGNDDKALISGIIWNRLNQNMRLQIDATAQYYKGVSGNWWPKVLPEHLQEDHPYNTYKIDALPPGPICNPSLPSLRAALYPTETDCLYYLHDHDKQIHCAQTFEEHKENIERYL